MSKRITKKDVDALSVYFSCQYGLSLGEVMLNGSGRRFRYYAPWKDHNIKTKDDVVYLVFYTDQNGALDIRDLVLFWDHYSKSEEKLLIYPFEEGIGDPVFGGWGLFMKGEAFRTLLYDAFEFKMDLKR